MVNMERQAHPRNRIGGSAASSMTTPKRQIAGLYDLEETLGEGHYAVVKLASHVFTGEKVAVKVIDKTKLDAATKIQMLQEVQLMKLVQHPHVVRLYEVIDTQTKLYLILEYADGGDMYDYIMKHEGGLSEDKARTYFKQIVTAIQYCHRLHVVHRDLKPENVVFFEKLGIVKLTDFGFSNQFNPGQRLETSCGSLAYSAPEILLGDAYDAPAVGKIPRRIDLFPVSLLPRQSRMRVHVMFIVFRYLVIGRDPVYARVWKCSVPRGQR